jgi:hypothetical protein
MKRVHAGWLSLLALVFMASCTKTCEVEFMGIKCRNPVGAGRTSMCDEHYEVFNNASKEARRLQREFGR